MKAAAALGAALIAFGTLGAPGPASAASPAWPHGLADPFARQAPVSGSGQLNGVFCTSASDCWAVGEFSTKVAHLNQVLHWTGKKWFKVAVPEPGGTGKEALNELNAVRCTSASDCWAVGDYAKGGAELNEILHWTGKKWFAVSGPTPAGTLPGDENLLADVACTSAGSCWAVGEYGTDDSTTRGQIINNQALHWNGKTWSLVPTPNPAGSKKNHANAILSVRCASPTNCWAAGTDGVLGKKFILNNEVLHWTGKKWSQVTVPNVLSTAVKGTLNELNGLSCTSAKNCLAVGISIRFGNKGRELNQILRWNGAKWTKDHVPNPDGSGPGRANGLVSVTCASPSDCWAVGSTGLVEKRPGLNQALHWTGAKWKSVATPNPAGTAKTDNNLLNAVRCTSPTDCWAVGIAQRGTDPSQDEALHWNGAKWNAS
ncbi:MAG TPA: hypothetical protein VFI65_30720 [Streptosporangiaceae bacterium]|nr:hypothetical protein [Streptosporangiaceae bacterium]